MDAAVKESRKSKYHELGNWKVENVKISEKIYADDMVVLG